MLELKIKPKDIDGITPYLYGKWYCGDQAVLRYVEYHRRPLKIIENIDHSPGMRILDIGCDWGYLLMYIQDYFRDVFCHGVDISDKNVEFGNTVAKYNGYNIHLEYGNVNNLRYRNDFFDYVVSTETFEHFFPSERIKILKECCRVLKPGGYLLMTTPNKYGMAEITKQFLGRHELFRSFIPMLPRQIEREGFVPGGATKGDRMTNIAESINSLKNKVEKAGFTVIRQNGFVFVPEITPNYLLKFARLAESVLERLTVFNFLATTQYIKARKQTISPGNSIES